MLEIVDVLNDKAGRQRTRTRDGCAKQGWANTLVGSLHVV